MALGFWGKKIGMTQIFDQDKAVAVTAIDITDWLVVGKKEKARDGYDAIQIGRLKKRYRDVSFDQRWLKQKKTYFSEVKEVPVENEKDFVIGKGFSCCDNLAKGDRLNISGRTKGKGFAGVVRRHGFSGGPASHGGKLGKHPGGISFMTSQGKVIKGKKLPGHLGNVKRMVRNLDVIDYNKDSGLVLVKGSIPGAAGSLVFLKRV